VNTIVYKQIITQKEKRVRRVAPCCYPQFSHLLSCKKDDK